MIRGVVSYKWVEDLDILKAKVDKLSTEPKQDYESIQKDLKQRIAKLKRVINE